MKKKQEGKIDKAYLKAVEALDKNRIDEIKVVVKRLLEGIVGAEKERKVADEKLAFLKLDLEDIRHGRIEKIKVRHGKAREESRPVPFDAEKLEQAFTQTEGIHGVEWCSSVLGITSTSGSFTLKDGSVVTMTNGSSNLPLPTPAAAAVSRLPRASF